MQINDQILKLVKPIRQVKKWIYFFARSLSTATTYRLFKKKNEKFCYSIPIIINNRNRYTYLRQLITSLENKGYKNLYIIDNDSKYQPLLDYYNTIPYKVYRLKINAGYCALWDTEVFKDFKNDYYVYTDSDIEVIDECPAHFMTFFFFLLHKYKHIGKAGFGLKIDDLPDSYSFKSKVVSWESGVLRKGKKLEKNAIQAQIDTTFALYRKGFFGPAPAMEAIRTTYPYIAKHLPWYEKTDNLDEEQQFYYNSTLTSSHWSKAVKTHLKDQLAMADEKPLVTIIAISYNQENYVKATLDSIKNQTYPNIQLIISDDGSKDKTKQIIRQWVNQEYPRAIFLDNAVNVGITKNLNRALTHIKGSFVKQIGCDDILTKDSVEIIMRKFSELPADYGIIYTNMHRINELGELIDDVGLIEKRGHPVYSGYVYKEMIKKPFITSASIIFKKEVLDKLKAFNEKVFYEDHDTYLRASKYFKFYYIPEKLVYYRIHGASLINSSSKIKYFLNTFNVYITSYDSRPEYKAIYMERILFCVKNLYYKKYKGLLHISMQAFMVTGEPVFLKYCAAAISLLITGKKS